MSKGTSTDPNFPLNTIAQIMGYKMSVDLSKRYIKLDQVSGSTTNIIKFNVNGDTFQSSSVTAFDDRPYIDTITGKIMVPVTFVSMFNARAMADAYNEKIELSFNGKKDEEMEINIKTKKVTHFKVTRGSDDRISRSVIKSYPLPGKVVLYDFYNSRHYLAYADLEFLTKFFLKGTYTFDQKQRLVSIKAPIIPQDPTVQYPNGFASDGRFITCDTEYAKFIHEEFGKSLDEALKLAKQRVGKRQECPEYIACDTSYAQQFMNQFPGYPTDLALEYAKSRSGKRLACNAIFPKK